MEVFIKESLSSNSLFRESVGETCFYSSPHGKVV